MARKCSQCGNNGHNTRTCNNPRMRSSVGSGSGSGGGLKLFGVHLPVAAFPMKKSFSIDYLSSSSNYHLSSCSSSPSSSPSISLASIDETIEKGSSGYLSDDLMGRNQERKKGVPWTEEEHRAFLTGLEKLGKGDWRGISRSFVTTRTPTQVASHAQKYFLRQNSLNKKMHQSTLFDMSIFQAGNCDSFIEKAKRNQVNHNNEPDLTVPEQVPFSYFEEPCFRPPLPNLDLSISSSRSWDQNKSSTRTRFI